MRRLLTICLFALAAVLVAAPAALAASGPAPTITRVKPMRVSVGNLITISGKNFKAQRNRNTVIFRAPNGRTAFAKPRRSTTRKLVVRVPAAVARLLRVSNSRQRPTRLKLRVLSGQFSKFTTRRLSPVVTGVGDGDGGPGGGGGGGGGTVVCNDSADHDGDLLPNTLELAIGTDPCLADTDNDQMTDGWEYWSARDLNRKALPYPGKRPFPNALDPSDGAPAPARFSAIDFDGDGLSSVEEYRAWRKTGSGYDSSREDGTDLESPLSYSDGTQYSRASEDPHVPSLRPPAGWTDDERDADGDGLPNVIESVHGAGQPSWWAGFYGLDAHKAEPWGPKPATTCDSQEFGTFEQRPFAELDMADPDVDGDGLLDGLDDQDNDGVTNIQEMYEATVSDLDTDGVTWSCDGSVYPAIDIDPGAGVTPMVVNAFNPCAPDPDSPTCAFYKPFE
jgi:hypothetical protein